MSRKMPKRSLQRSSKPFEDQAKTTKKLLKKAGAWSPLQPRQGLCTPKSGIGRIGQLKRLDSKSTHVGKLRNMHVNAVKGMRWSLNGKSFCKKTSSKHSTTATIIRTTKSKAAPSKKSRD
jgi:hypothetical protein